MIVASTVGPRGGGDVGGGGVGGSSPGSSSSSGTGSGNEMYMFSSGPPRSMEAHGDDRVTEPECECECECFECGKGKTELGVCGFISL